MIAFHKLSGRNYIEYMHFSHLQVFILISQRQAIGADFGFVVVGFVFITVECFWLH